MIKQLIIIFFSILFIDGYSAKTRPASSRADSTLSIMTYNVHHCNPPSAEGVIDVGTIAAVIHRENADLVALQEIDVNTGRSGKISEAAQIAEKAGYPYSFFAKAIDFDGGGYGVLILSKHPFSNPQVHRLPSDKRIKGEPRVLATVTVTLPNGKLINFGCTHLDSEKNDANRLLQIDEINRVSGSIAGVFIIAGDFNSTEGNEVINRLDKHFVRSCHQCAATLPGEEQVTAIDFIAARPTDKFTFLSHRVLSSDHGSDHFPVTAQLRLRF